MKFTPYISTDKGKQAELQAKILDLLEEYRVPMLVMYGLTIESRERVELRGLDNFIVQNNELKTGKILAG